MWGYAGIRFDVYQILSNPLKYSFEKIFYYDGEISNLIKNTLVWRVWRRFVGIFRDYPLKTRPNKQPIGEIP
jgi:hypothetical protein